jgi:hypothetical protein
MTNRVTELRAGEAAKRASSGIGSRGDMADRPVARHGIPLDLVPLLSPYKGKGRLTLRVERMPHAARLSAGRNNGDNSWSLALDELEDLEYLLPQGSTNAHTLALRVLAHNGDGASTLAVLDLPILSDTVGSSPAANLRGAPAVAASAGDNIQVSQLRDELAKAAAALAAREVALAEAQRRAERTEAEIALKDKALADALAARKIDRDACVAAATAQASSDLERSRDAWQAEQNERIVELEARAETRIAQASESWQREMQDAFSKAQSSWEAGEADRLAAVERQWQARANKALAEAQARVETRLKESETELHRVRDDLAQARAIVAERDAELTRMRSASEAALQREQQQLDAALSKAEASKTRRHEKSAGAVAELTARCERAEAALADARAHLEAEARPGMGDAELREVRDVLTATQAILAEREQDLVKARAAIEAAHQREQEQIETARSMAEATWRTNEVERLAAAERHREGEHGKHLAEAKARYVAAEFALADMGKRAHQQGATVDELRSELAMLQSILDSRGLELARMRATFEPDRRDSSDLIKGLRSAAADSGDGQEVVQSERSLVRDVVVVVGAVMALALIYFNIEAFLPEYLRIPPPTTTTEGSDPAIVSTAPERPAPAPVSSIARDTASVTRGVNLRAGPSTAADVVVKLPPGVDVEVIEQSGNWTRVQIRDKHDPSKLQQGWIYNSYIKVTAVRPEKSAVTNHGQGQSP